MFVSGKQRIVCAAIRSQIDGKILCSARHLDVLMQSMMLLDSRVDWRRAEQGFIDQFGTFLTREEALPIAQEAGQILRRCGGDEKQLWSENLY